jgi:Transmembrane amino acid transporter protein
MRDKTKFTFVGYSALYFCAAIYVVPALLMYLAYEGNQNPKLQDLYYRTFIAKTFIKFLNDLMNINFLYGMTSFTIYNMEMLEKIKIFKPLIRDQDMNLRSFNVLMFRVVFVIAVLVISTFITDLRLVYAFNGVLLNSFIGLIIPGLMGLMRSEKNRERDSIVAKSSDWFCLISGVLSLLLFFMDLAIGKD